jgi:DNA polymerase-1
MTCLSQWTMMRLVFDIEADNLLEEATVIHCASVYDITTERIYRFTPDMIEKSFIGFLDRATELIGHNIIGFDLPVLKKLLNWEPKPDVMITDTLVWSRVVFPDRVKKDLEQRKIEPKLYGKHSLESWGQRMSFNKGTFGEDGVKDFSVYSEDMLEYCARDTRLTRYLTNFLSKSPNSRKSLELEQDIHRICLKQENDGFPFNVREAVKLYSKLAEKRDELQKELVATFGTWIESDGEVTPKTSNKRIGFVKGIPYTKIKLITFNPNSRFHIAKRLIDFHGWKPKEFTPTGEPKIDEKVLRKLKYPEAQLLAEAFRINKIIAMLAEGDQAWLKLEKQGRLHGSVNTMGTVSSRCSHHNPNLGQVPSTKVEFGRECRSLFGNQNGWRLVGCDVSGLEIRTVAHYLAQFDSGEFARTVLEGDIHTTNQRAAGLETRDQAKTFIYALLYGAGDAKLGEIVGKGVKAGKELRERFYKNIPAFKKLRDSITEIASKKSYLTALDGRYVPIRSEHSALNLLCQSAGAIICKKWVVEFHKLMKEKGLIEDVHYQQVAFVHDEIQVLVKEGYEEIVGEGAVAAISRAGESFNLRIPLTGEYKVGNNWGETH